MGGEPLEEIPDHLTVESLQHLGAEQSVLAELEHGSWTLTELEARTSVDRTVVWSALTRLETQGMVHGVWQGDRCVRLWKLGPR